MELLRKEGLSLYYKILKLHSKILPPDMKGLGNAYLKEEFKLNRKSNQAQYKEFLNQWLLKILSNKFFFSQANLL
jgi:hypothetical protein